MQATTVVLVVFCIAIPTCALWALWAWWRNPWRRIRYLLLEEDFTFMECEFFPGREILYSETLWIEMRQGSPEFRISFRDVPGGEMKGDLSFSVTPGKKHYMEIAIHFALHTHKETLSD